MSFWTRICRPWRPLAASVLLLTGSLAGAAPAPRTLLIGVDAVSYHVVAQLTDPALGERALFKGFKRPSVVITTFPSDTHVAWAGLLAPLGVHKSHGYQPRYFDNALHEIEGGLSLVETPAPWEEFFDWRLEGILQTAVAYGWPKTFSLSELKQGLAAFVKSDKPVFAMYIVSTDGIAHIEGPAALADFLVELDRSLMAVHRAHPEMPFYTVMISDHGVAGGEALDNVWPALQDAMGKAGLRVSEKLKDRSDAVFIPYGLLSSFVIHTWQGREAEVARLAVAVPGVDLCVRQDSAGWEVGSSRGTARIAMRPAAAEAEWMYQPVSGDPLGYEAALAQLRGRAGAAGQRWFPDSWWFAATKNEFYPDGLYRLADSFQAVENAASVACSVSPGYMFGALKTEYMARSTIGRLRWTHGALYRDASLGFVLSDLPHWNAPDAVRFDQALLPLAKPAKQDMTAYQITR